MENGKTNVKVEYKGDHHGKEQSRLRHYIGFNVQMLAAFSIPQHGFPPRFFIIIDLS
jgi:hypothetical protein